MKIFFKTRKLEKIINNRKKLVKAYGQSAADTILRRLDDMYVAENMSKIFALPGNYHPLTGDLKGKFACNVNRNYRIIFEPATRPLPVNEHNMLIYEEIEEITILSIEDYH